MEFIFNVVGLSIIDIKWVKFENQNMNAEENIEE